MITNQYYTTRRNTYYNPIVVLEELAVQRGESNANTIVAPTLPATNSSGLRLTNRPVIGQLIVLTLVATVEDDLSVGFQSVSPIVSETSNAFTQFNLAAVGMAPPRNEYSPGGADWGMQSSIWYRVVDNYDLIAWDAGKGYYGWVYNSATGSSLHMMTVTHLSRGSYWTTPITPLSGTTSTYGNSTIYPATTNAMIAGGSNVDVQSGGFVIASCARPDSTVAASVNNSFTLTTQDRNTGSGRLFTARRIFTENATGQNTTFSFSTSKYTATAIAAFNP
jgi:hypothetical protein